MDINWRGLLSRRKLRKIKTFTLDRNKQQTFICDEVIIQPTKGMTPMFKNIDLIVCADGVPLCRLLGGSDILRLGSGDSEFKVDVMNKNGKVCIYPESGRMRVEWDGSDLYLTNFIIYSRLCQKVFYKKPKHFRRKFYLRFFCPYPS